MFDKIVNAMENIYLLTLSAFLVFCIYIGCARADVPQDAVIIVQTKDGREIGRMSRSEYKVVKIGTSKTTTIRITKTRTIYKKSYCNANSRLSIKNGVDGDGYVFGAGYSRKIGPALNIGISTHTNKITTLDVGLDF